MHQWKFREVEKEAGQERETGIRFRTRSEYSGHISQLSPDVPYHTATVEARYQFMMSILIMPAYFPQNISGHLLY